MSKASLTSKLISPAKANLAVNLDIASRSQIVTAACCQLYNLKQVAQIGEWRKRAADWDLYELIGRARDLGVKFYQGNEPFELPTEVVVPMRGHQ